MALYKYVYDYDYDYDYTTFIMYAHVYLLLAYLKGLHCDRCRRDVGPSSVRPSLRCPSHSHIPKTKQGYYGTLYRI